LANLWFKNFVYNHEHGRAKSNAKNSKEQLCAPASADLLSITIIVQFNKDSRDFFQEIL